MTTSERPPVVVSIWGPEKSAKSTFGLTFPQRIVVHDFDIGYSRAAYRAVPPGGSESRGEDGSQNILDSHGNILVTCYSYPAPLNITVQKLLHGYKELWYRFLENFMKGLVDPTVRTIMIDTATQMWQICHMAYLQEKQEAQLPLNPAGKDANGKTLRESLIPIEYAEPNARMRAVEQAGKGYGKNLVITHYQAAVYSKRMNGDRIEEYDTGEKQLDGFKHTANLSDVVLRSFIKDGKPKATITVSGLSLNLVGVTMDEPSYDGLMEALDMLRTV